MPNSLTESPIPCIAYFSKLGDRGLIEDVVLRGYYFPRDLAEDAEFITVWGSLPQKDQLAYGVSMPMETLKWLVAVR